MIEAASEAPQATLAPAAEPASDLPPPLYSSRYTKYVLGLLTTVYIYGFIDRQLMGIVMEPIRRELGLSDTQLGLLTGVAFGLFYVTLGIPVARLADMLPRRLIIAVSLTLWSMFTAASGLAGNFAHLMLARIGVGIGEAGGTPPSHSLISDYFPPSRRASALSIYSTAPAVGSMLAFLFGGWISQYFGWRAAFLALGIPGLLLALTVWRTVKEPPRGYFERRVKEPVPPFFEVVRHLGRQRSFVHLAAAMALVGFSTLGMLQWVPAFFMRSHGLTSGQAGTVLALLLGIGGGLGAFLGGTVADRLAARDARWYVWIAGGPLIVATPLIAGTFLFQSPVLAILCFAFIPLAITAHMGPVYGLAQSLALPRMRTTASAIMLFVTNIVGLGFGPVAVGALSDFLRATQGEESLRHALLLFSVPTALWAGTHFILAGRSLRRDLAAMGWVHGAEAHVEQP